MQGQDLKDIDEMAKKLKVKRSWIYGKTRTNEMPHIKLGKYLRFVESEVMTWARQYASQK